jgi:outer membrane protein assembly factor BamB
VAWTFDDGAGTGTGCATPSAAGGLLYFTTGNYGSSTQGGRGIYAIDPKTHKAVWSYRTAGRVCARPAIAYGRLYVPRNDGRLYCFEPCSADYNPPEPQAPPVVPAAPLRPLAEMPAGKLGAKGEQDKPAGGKDWPMYGGCPARCGLEVSIGMPIKPAWEFQTGGKVRSSPVIADGTAYVGSDIGKLFALDLATGKRKWSVEIGTRIRCSPAVAGDIVVCGADDGVLRAFRTPDGAPKWEFRTGGPILASPAIVGERVVFGSNDHRCYCVRLTDGKEFWRYEAGHEIHAPPAAANGTVYVGAWDWAIHALDLGTGRPLEGFGKRLITQKQTWLADRRPSWYLNPTRLGRVEGVAVYRSALAVCATGDESYGQSLLLDAASGELVALSGVTMYKEIMDSNGWAFGAPAFSGRWMFIPCAWKPTGVLDVEAREFLGEESRSPSPLLNTPLSETVISLLPSGLTATVVKLILFGAAQPPMQQVTVKDVVMLQKFTHIARRCPRTLNLLFNPALRQKVLIAAHPEPKETPLPPGSVSGQYMGPLPMFGGNGPEIVFIVEATDENVALAREALAAR